MASVSSATAKANPTAFFPKEIVEAIGEENFLKAKHLELKEATAYLDDLTPNEVESLAEGVDDMGRHFFAFRIRRKEFSDEEYDAASGQDIKNAENAEKLLKIWGENIIAIHPRYSGRDGTWVSGESGYQQGLNDFGGPLIQPKSTIVACDHFRLEKDVNKKALTAITAIFKGTHPTFRLYTGQKPTPSDEKSNG